jgi:hypothetical protein
LVLQHFICRKNGRQWLRERLVIGTTVDLSKYTGHDEGSHVRVRIIDMGLSENGE